MPNWSTYGDRELAQEASPAASAALTAWASSTSPAYCRDMSGRVLAANLAFSRKFGKAASSLAGIQALVNPDDMPLFISGEEELRGPPHQVSRAERWMTPQGWRWMAWEETALLDERGVPAAVRAIGHDITRQRLAEELFTKLSRAVEQCPVAIVITDAEGRAQYVNPKFTQVSGHSLEACMERETRVLRDGHPTEESYAKLMASVAAGGEWHGELERVGPGGNKIWESVQVCSIRNAVGEVTNLLCLREDITQRRQLEDELRQSQKMESLGTLAGGIAHDFNNLLAVINGYAELSSLHPNDTALWQKSLREIRRAAQRAIGLVRQILTFSRKDQVKFAPVDVNQLVRDLVALLSETFPRKVTFNTSGLVDMPAMMADQNQLQQVVLNLFVNARDAMPDGGVISVSTSLVPGESLTHKDAVRGSHYACLQVSDTGIGIPADVKARIFEPFFTTKACGQGTGLGLAVVYGIITGHRGFIDVDSAPGAGTTFKILLPSEDAGTVATVSSELNAFPDGTETILIVDDEDGLRHILRTTFTRKGYSVLSASNGVEALEVLANPAHSVDVVLLDINMPGASGVEVLRSIRASRPDLPVLVLSGHIGSETRNSLDQLGQTDYLLKPYRLDELGRRIRGIIAPKPAPRPLAKTG